MINFLWAGMFLAAIAAALWNLAVYQDSGSFSLLTEAIFQKCAKCRRNLYRAGRNFKFLAWYA